MIRGSQHRRVWWYSLASAVVLVAVGTSVSTPSAQSGYVHLNPVVEALAQGRHVFGVNTSDLSIENAVALAGNPNLDYVYLDMEHNPLRFQEMKHFLAFITAGDKAGIIKRGNGQVRPAVFARFPPNGREQTLWMVKHALDIGLNGILINNVETKEQAENIVRTMRPTQRRDSKIPNPPGVRGTSSCCSGGDAGLRCGEIMALEWDDVDLNKRQVCVRSIRMERPGDDAKERSASVRAVDDPTRGGAPGPTAICVTPRVLHQDDRSPLTQKIVQDWMRRTARRAQRRSGGRAHPAAHFCSHLAMRGAPAGRFKSWPDTKTWPRRSATCT